MGDPGAAQLHIGHAVLPVKIQNTGIIQLHPVLIFIQPLSRHQARVGLYGHIRPRDPQFIGKPADAPGTVAAHLSPGAVGIVKMKPEIRLVGAVHSHESIGIGKFT